ncbi:MAG TPA: hypothetical protein VMJ32_15420 [Pirellulales bacterium]|nr:hypothetical protein [Pirellulales bacterium]
MASPAMAMMNKYEATCVKLLACMLLANGSTFAHAQGADKVAKSEWVYSGPDGKLVYKKTPAGDRIMDFSTAGYMGGGVALPNVPVKATVKPSGGADDTATIQGAINAVSELPLENGFRGSVLMEPGTYICSAPITISTTGIVLRGSGSGAAGTIIKMVGDKHTAISLGTSGGRGRVKPADIENQNPDEQMPESTTHTVKAIPTAITDAYVPSGTATFTVANATHFAVGDTIAINRPVTEAWVKFMQMDNLVRSGRHETWVTGAITTLRKIVAISKNTITVDIPLSDCFDAKFLPPPGATVEKVILPAMVMQAGIEHLRIASPPQAVEMTAATYSGLHIVGEDCWVQDVTMDNTVNSVGIGGRRITLLKVVVNHEKHTLGAAKPADFGTNASQLLLDRCSGKGDEVFYAATGSGQTGPIVLLNCTFYGNGHIQPHMRWSTGMLVDNCTVPNGGIDYMNRGEMGTGHGWTMGWAVAWNCIAKSFVIQNPPGVDNWMIGCIGENVPTARPFDKEPKLTLGIMDSPGKRVSPQSLYLAQLSERLGPQALQNIGYEANSAEMFPAKSVKH